MSGLLGCLAFPNAIKLDGTGYTPMSRRSDLLLFKLRPSPRSAPSRKYPLLGRLTRNACEARLCAQWAPGGRG